MLLYHLTLFQCYFDQFLVIDRPLVKSANRKIVFLFRNQNICCGYSNEQSQWDGSFEHPDHTLKIMGKKYLQFYAENFCLSKLVELLSDTKISLAKIVFQI